MFLAEIILFITGVLILFLDSLFYFAKTAGTSFFKTASRFQVVVPAVTYIGLAAAFIWIGLNLYLGQAAEGIFVGAVGLDSSAATVWGKYFVEQGYSTGLLSQTIKAILIFSTILGVVISSEAEDALKIKRDEIAALLIFATLGACGIVASNNLIYSYFSLEIASLGGLLLSALRKKDRLASEASVKLFIYWATTSLCVVLGIGIYYVLTKSFLLSEIKVWLLESLHKNPQDSVGVFAMGWLAFSLIIVGFASRAAIFPFQFLLSDMTEASPTVSAAFLAVPTVVSSAFFVVKLAYEVLTLRGDTGWSALDGFNWPVLFSVLGACGMCLGSFLLLNQKKIRRILGFSMVIHAGLFMAGASAVSSFGVSSVVIGFIAYSLAFLGLFIVLELLSVRKGFGHALEISHLRGLVWSHPYYTVVFCFFILSVAGFPPCIGFISRFYILSAIIQNKTYWLALVLCFCWILSLPVYLTMIKALFDGQAKANKNQKIFGSQSFPALVNIGVLFLICVPLIGFGIFWNTLAEFVYVAVSSGKW